ncbi:WXG100 family type VII secretion target [Anaerosporobacter faecicola]|uniref:WXG100 family type VII secretion target n=1 Tax=Anaerosporobacter faecicola TaxID=2718714 RepID=UPI00143B5845|nr:WXG100 family type VII secretion target [Anaerosporobacter faecicola]
MSAFQVTAKELGKKALDLQQLNARFKTEVTDLETTETALKSMWEGSANNAFHTAFMNDKGQMVKFHNAIEKYCEALVTIATKYQTAENTNTDTASKRKY